MNVFRCIALSVVVLLSACDAQENPAPKPKVSEQAQSQAKSADAKRTAEPVVKAEATPSASAPVKAPVHYLAPNVPVVPVVTRTDGSASAGKPEKSSVAKAAATKPASDKKRDAVARKSVVESKKTLKATSLSNAKLDLSLPPDLAEELQPAGATKAKPRKPLLPPMFGDKDNSSGGGPFELNGRILSNEMQLQMRNDNRRDVEGAALDFKFRQ